MLLCALQLGGGHRLTNNGSMSPPPRARAIVPGLALAAIALLGGDHRGQAAAEDPACRVVEFEITPTADLQIVVWLEDVEGNYVDTLFITRKTGSYGLGNRPGPTAGASPPSRSGPTATG